MAGESDLKEISHSYVTGAPGFHSGFFSSARSCFGRPQDFFEKINNEIHVAFLDAAENILEKKLYVNESGGSNWLLDIDLPLQKLGERVVKEKFITDIYFPPLFNDEPKLFIAGSHYGDFLKNNSDAGGPSSSTANAASFKDRNDAFIKFLGETFERTSNAFYKKSDLVFSSFSKLKQKSLNAVNPEDFSGFSQNQLKKEYLAKTKVDKDSVLGWTRGKSLITGKKILIPAQTVYTPYKYENGETIIRLPITTGAAAHTDFGRALYRGICEVIERDAFMIFYLNKLSPPIVNLENSFDGCFKPIVKSIERYNLEVYVLDITTDIPVPAFLTLIIDRTGEGPVVSPGNKADLDIKKAIEGSIEEALKVRYFGRHKFIQNQDSAPAIGKNYGPTRTTTGRCLFWSRPEMIKEIEFFISGPKKILSGSPVDSGSEDNLEKIITYLNNNNLEAIAVDTTIAQAKECGFSAVMVVMPQFQPLYLWEEYKCLGGRRLYEVPVKLGYFDKPKKEEELNSVPHPFL